MTIPLAKSLSISTSFHAHGLMSPTPIVHRRIFKIKRLFFVLRLNRKNTRIKKNDGWSDDGGRLETVRSQHEIIKICTVKLDDVIPQ